MNPIPLSLNQGADRSTTPLRSGLDTLFALTNLRQSLTAIGQLETTPKFYLQQTLAQATYWNGAASVTETSTSPVLGMFADVNGVMNYITAAAFWRNAGATQAHVFILTAQPTTATIYGNCLLVVNTTAHGVTLGLSYEIEIDAVGTFKWQKNGGGYTAGVPITAQGVSIDGGNATVYFLTATAAYVATDHWTFTRTDSLLDNTATATSSRPTRYMHFRGKVYFLDSNMRVLVFDPATNIVRSWGYRKIYATELFNFANHITLGCAATTAPASITAARAYPGGLTYTNGDNVDTDNFFATDTNEADSQVLASFAIEANPSEFIWGFSMLNETLWIHTSRGSHSTQYFGLPIVFDVKQYLPFTIDNATTAQPIVNSTTGCYIIQKTEITFFDGVNYQHMIDPPPIAFTSYTNTYEYDSGLRFGIFDFALRELIIAEVDSATNCRLFCYQEGRRGWYTRKTSFSNAVLTCLYTDRTVGVNIGHTSRKVYREDITGQQTPVSDSTSGAAIGGSSFETQLYAQPIFNVKSVESAYIAAALSDGPSSSLYSTGAAVSIFVDTQISTDGLIGSSYVSGTDAWISTNPTGLVSTPRVSARMMNFRVRLLGTGSKPAMGVIITAFEPNIQVANAPATR